MGFGGIANAYAVEKPTDWGMGDWCLDQVPALLRRIWRVPKTMQLAAQLYPTDRRFGGPASVSIHQTRRALQTDIKLTNL